MKRTYWLTFFLILGLGLSQLLPFLGNRPLWLGPLLYYLQIILLAYIMIKVGQEFEFDAKNKKVIAVDYAIAVTAAAFPWIFVSLYFYAFLIPASSLGHPQWIEAILVGRFAAPTSAGVLFTMLAASGLTHTWVFKKTRILAIFDDLDTVLLMIPLQMLIVGFVWQLAGVIVILTVMIILGIKFYRRMDIPQSWPWMISYSILLLVLREGIYLITKDPSSLVGMHIEILLPAFLFGCALKGGHQHTGNSVKRQEGVVGLIISALFMFVVGLSMPVSFGEHARQNSMETHILIFHILMVTLLSNLGKMFASFCYRREATLKERIAVSIALFPRGEVGAGILAISLSYGITGPHLSVAFMSLTLNLLLTGLFITIVKTLITETPR